ncbi:putative cytochrome p450 protein [Botrytis fragariae]|uniref:Putative cytochrome p450 protein n=1 Tax=Botrytis fragariae TaxID=1964551 RepID=A0A8H6AMJ3_9HELO|nr:putative cytochrome p450 protein [Botrytis fragariae]KAF5870518.1 putative cytochrome p450 protein [Botrytis fragariae]
MFISIIISIVIAICLGSSLYKGSEIRRNGKKLRRPPNTLPLVGNGILFLQARHKLFSWFVKCERKFGWETFEISVPSLPPGVVINDPKNLEFVLKNEGIFAKGDFFKSRSWDLFGNGIINADGDLWKVQRKAGLNFLNASNLKVLTDVALPKYLEESLAQLRIVGNGKTIDLEAVFHELTTKLMGRMAYDMDMRSGDPFSLAFEYASGATGERFQNPLWPVTEMLFGGRFRSSIAKVKAFGTEIVSNAVRARQEKSQVNNEQNSLDSISGSLINSLLNSIDDHQMVADAALNYLSAGRDTTAQALTWAFYLLMRHPRVMDSVRQEAASLTKGPNRQSTTYKPTIVPYIMAVFYEALRLYPPVPFEIKQCEQATTLPDGTFLPEHAVLVWCPWAMNRSRSIWGDDADNFRPERWLEDGVIILKTAFEYPVFNGGPRTCLGKKMAEAVAAQVIATLVVNFNFSLIDQKERISKNSLTLPMEGGLPCKVSIIASA